MENKKLNNKIFVFLRQRDNTISYKNTNLFGLLKSYGLKNIDNISGINYFKSKKCIVDWPAEIIPIDPASFLNDLIVLSDSLFKIELEIDDHNSIYIEPFISKYTTYKWKIKARDFFDYYDLKELEDFRKFNHKYLKSRIFNSLKIINNWILKESNLQKLSYEYKFLEFQHESKNNLYPAVRNYKKVGEQYSYEVEYIECVDASILLKNNLLKGDVLKKFTNQIIFYFTSLQSQSKKPSQNDIVFFTSQIKKRIRLLLEEQETKNYVNFLSQLHKKNYNHLIISKMNNFFSLTNNNEIGKYALIHGDLCLSNILFNYPDNTIKLIDPKGLNPYKNKFPLLYDLAKLSHSLLGNYDFILSGQLNINPIEIYNFEIELNEEYVKLITLLGKIINVDFKTVRLLESILFLTMIPLHKESQKNILNFISNFIIINNQLDKNF